MTRGAGPHVLPAAWTGAVLVADCDRATQRLSNSALLPVGVITGVVGGVYRAGRCGGNAGRAAGRTRGSQCRQGN